VGRASPPANRYGGQGRPPHQPQPFFIFRCVREEMIVGMKTLDEAGSESQADRGAHPTLKTLNFEPWTFRSRFSNFLG
jgi:hypothetical protein